MLLSCAGTAGGSIWGWSAVSVGCCVVVTWYLPRGVVRRPKESSKTLSKASSEKGWSNERAVVIGFLAVLDPQLWLFGFHIVCFGSWWEHRPNSRHSLLLGEETDTFSPLSLILASPELSHALICHCLLCLYSISHCFFNELSEKGFPLLNKSDNDILHYTLKSSF